MSVFLVGHTYRTLSGRFVKIVSEEMPGSSYHTVLGDDGKYRYARRDFGRCTAADVNCEDNLLPSICDYDLGRIGMIYILQDSLREVTVKVENSYTEIERQVSEGRKSLLEALIFNTVHGLSPSARQLV